MLNPEGFHHSPASHDGCVLFVKLRQFGGDDRVHQRTDTTSLKWMPVREGVSEKKLYSHAQHAETIVLEQWQTCDELAISAPSNQLFEVLFLSGTATDKTTAVSYRRWSWVRVPVGDTLRLAVTEPCEVYIKRGEWRGD